MKRKLLVGLFAVGLLATTPANAVSFTDPAVQTSIQSVLSEVHKSITNRFVVNTAVGTPTCQPQFNWSFTGLSLVFTASSTCHLGGQIGITFLPLAANVDLTVSGLPYVNSVEFTANISFTGSAGVLNLGYQFLDGTVAVTLSPSLPTLNLVLNGNSSLSFGSGKFDWATRTNVFEASSTDGFAIVSNLQTNPSINLLQACTLAGGAPNSVTSGTMSACANIVQ